MSSKYIKLKRSSWPKLSLEIDTYNGSPLQRVSHMFANNNTEELKKMYFVAHSS